MAAPSPPTPSQPRRSLPSFASLEILVSLVAPPIIFSVTSNKVPTWQAYAYSAVPCAAMLLFNLALARSWGLFAPCIVFSVVAQILLAYYMEGNTRVTNLGIVLPNVVLAGMWLSSLTWTSGNAIAILAKTGGPEGTAEAERMWAIPAYRVATGRMCLIWGIGYLVISALLLIVDFVAIDAFNTAQIVITIVGPILCGVLTYLYRRYLLRQRERRAAEERT
ncbi:hypothetical protein BC830DRAFT_1155758 [Chytriomyces sp. MP71]|nr:hypothetical protein BC830DRAFT_1155758 [Chytriomyces sp. MP71]